MRVFSSSSSNCFKKSIKNKIDLMQHDQNALQKRQQQQYHDYQHHNLYRDYQNEREQWSLPIRCSYFFAFILVTLFMQHSVTTVAANDGRTGGSLNGVTKGFRSRIRSPKIASIHILQAVPESLPKQQPDQRTVAIATSTADNQTNIPPAGKFEIRSVSGEPNYKSVNLTWEVEFVMSDQDVLYNSSREVEPPNSFQVFFCEMQSFGPHRCRSKIVNGTSSRQMYESVNNDLGDDVEQMYDCLPITSRQVRQYMTQVENLRMATKYSFHIRPMQKHRNMKVTGRSELFDNEIEGEDFLSNNLGQGQTIVIPTKGFSAEATRCLPTASEIEVETGPYFGGKIVVDGGNCGVKGDPSDAKDKYVMRIDHKTCGSMVKPETNTVETFITVQENLGIFTHSTRRFVVVCSYQSGLQTVRASFTVPGRGGASAVQQDHYEEEERMGRGLKPMRFVDKSALVLKETDTTEVNAAFQETEAMIEEMHNPTINYNYSDAEATAADDTTNAVATLENIIPGVNEEHIKQTEVNENEMHNNIDEQQQEIEVKDNKAYKTRSNNSSRSSLATTAANDDDNNADSDATDADDSHEQFSAKYAKLTLELNDRLQNEADDHSDSYRATPTGRGLRSGVELISVNMGSILLTVLLSVILIGIFVYVLYRETKLPPPLSTSNLNSSKRHHQHTHLHETVDTLPRTLRNKNQNTLA